MVETGMNPLNVTSRELGPGVHEVKIDGSLDWSNFAKVEQVVTTVFRAGIFKIVVNLRDAKYISSAGFGCFISALDTAMKNGGDLIFAAVPKEIHEVFVILGLAKILRFSDDEKQAAALLLAK
ncbi:MAG TPA: STAS domain-containing protein [Planctomycetota bacterium]|nr:STAS domain-containing protein [Planctomycetota bacterium]